MESVKRNMNNEAINEALDRHELFLKGEGGERANFEQQDLSGFDFSGRNVSRINFRHADLKDADFSEATCRRTDFRHANLQFANFTKAVALRANFYHADCYAAVMREADFKMCNFRHTQIANADFSWSDLRDADLRNVRSFCTPTLTIMTLDGWTAYITVEAVRIDCKVFDVDHLMQMTDAEMNAIPDEGSLTWLKRYRPLIGEVVRRMRLNLTAPIPFNFVNP